MFVLVVADVLAFAVIRGLLRAVRDHAALGEWVASHVATVAPRGLLSGWQYAAALFVALLVTGNYGRGDARRSSRRVFLACALATALPLWMTLWTVGFEPVLLRYALTTVLVWGGLVVERRLIDQIVARFQPLWQHAESLPAYRDKTTMVVIPEVGRDGDIHGNGFANHRSGDDSCRRVWLLALGAGVPRGVAAERVIRHIDVAPTVAKLLGFNMESEGTPLGELAI